MLSTIIRSVPVDCVLTVIFVHTQCSAKDTATGSLRFVLVQIRISLFASCIGGYKLYSLRSHIFRFTHLALPVCPHTERTQSHSSPTTLVADSFPVSPLDDETAGVSRGIQKAQILDVRRADTAGVGLRSHSLGGYNSGFDSRTTAEAPQIGREVSPAGGSPQR